MQICLQMLTAGAADLECSNTSVCGLPALQQLQGHRQVTAVGLTLQNYKHVAHGCADEEWLAMQEWSQRSKMLALL